MAQWVHLQSLIAFFRTHPNLVFLWHKGRNFRAITGDCRLTTLVVTFNIFPFDHRLGEREQLFLVLFNCLVYKSSSLISQTSLQLFTRKQTILVVQYHCRFRYAGKKFKINLWNGELCSYFSPV